MTAQGIRVPVVLLVRGRHREPPVRARPIDRAPAEGVARDRAGDGLVPRCGDARGLGRGRSGGRPAHCGSGACGRLQCVSGHARGARSHDPDRARAGALVATRPQRTLARAGSGHGHRACDLGGSYLARSSCGHRNSCRRWPPVRPLSRRLKQHESPRLVPAEKSGQPGTSDSSRGVRSNSQMPSSDATAYKGLLRQTRARSSSLPRHSASEPIPDVPATPALEGAQERQQAPLPSLVVPRRQRRHPPRRLRPRPRPRLAASNHCRGP